MVRHKAECIVKLIQLIMLTSFPELGYVESCLSLRQVKCFKSCSSGVRASVPLALMSGSAPLVYARGNYRFMLTTGIFLSFLPCSTKSIVWYDVEAAHIKIAKHAGLDEGMNDIPICDLAPSIQHHQHVQHGNAIPANPEDIEIPDFLFTHRPFLDEDEKTPDTMDSFSSTPWTVG
jgi:hypothetical protein